MFLGAPQRKKLCCLEKICNGIYLEFRRIILAAMWKEQQDGFQGRKGLVHITWTWNGGGLTGGCLWMGKCQNLDTINKQRTGFSG